MGDFSVLGSTTKDTKSTKEVRVLVDAASSPRGKLEFRKACPKNDMRIVK